MPAARCAACAADHPWSWPSGSKPTSFLCKYIMRNSIELPQARPHGRRDGGAHAAKLLIPCVRLPGGRRCGCAVVSAASQREGKNRRSWSPRSRHNLTSPLASMIARKRLLATAADNEILMVVYPSLQYSFDLEELSPMLFDVVLGVVCHLIEIR